MILEPWVLLLLGFGAAGIGALGGLGGAILLVPALVVLGVSPLEAAPLGMLTVAAGSLAASQEQLTSGLTHHRLGMVTELAAAAGAFAGALASTAFATPVLVRVLGIGALLAAVLGLARRGMRNLPQAAFAAESAGEWPGTLSGSYRTPIGVVPYTARRVPLGVAVMGGVGALAGLVGLGGGVLKTPITSEVMGIPVKVAAATSLFTVGITASAALVVFGFQGRIDVVQGSAVVLGALAGGWLGALAQTRLEPVPSRVVVGLLVGAVGLGLVVRG